MILADLKHTWGDVWRSLEPIKPHLDAATVGTFAATLLGLLPGIMTAITTVVTLLWSCIRLYETTTVQRWLARRAARKGAPL